MYPGIRQILFIDIRIWMLGDSDIDIDWRPAYVMFSLPFSPLVFFSAFLQNDERNGFGNEKHN